ncbi:Ribosomal large subunit pseudouridine synthase D [Buchnera aphidicola (Pterocallis alni)]|uniref:RluA family pseudouridine synthase n=1 Tax=Buchnera aphidicola TaxID=9 RepID=UPI003464C4EE
MKKKISFIILPIHIKKNRLDVALTDVLKKYSRSYVKDLILTNLVMVNNKIVNIPNKKVFPGDKITIFVIDKNIFHIGENIDLNIFYEDYNILIINKPAGLVVHPGNGNHHGTLLNALLYRNKNIQYIPRCGIIHRLDKNTTGLIIIAKDIITYLRLIDLMKKKEIIRQYQAFVFGNLTSGDIISAPIMRDINRRIRMMVHKDGKPSITYYNIIQKFQYYTHLNIQLFTGRTHQIRLHMMYIKHPVLGDPVYKLRNCIPKKIKKKFFFRIQFCSRQCLHASHIKFIHPIIHKDMSFYVSIPDDMMNIIKYL